jgi:hypothetical protein
VVRRFRETQQESGKRELRIMEGGADSRAQGGVKVMMILIGRFLSAIGLGRMKLIALSLAGVVFL